MASWEAVIRGLPKDRPLLLAGPTASGKSALAAEAARALGGAIINADALQVYAPWRVLTARPSPAEEAAWPHALYGHVPAGAPYSVGHWLREVAPLLQAARPPVIVGGTGLYFQALTRGLAAVPDVPPEVRHEADAMTLAELIAGLDPGTAGRIDLANRARVQRAWEVRRATGRGLADWQAETPAPLLPAAQASTLVLMPDVAWLDARIARRFDQMLAEGALDEVARAFPAWQAGAPWTRAIGAEPLVAALQGRLPLSAARDEAVLASRRYAKRQRTWARSNMADWTALSLPAVWQSSTG